MGKTLQFPQARSKRVRALVKTEANRLFLSMSLFSLILVAVFSSEQMVKMQRPIYIVSDNGVAQEVRGIAATGKAVELVERPSTDFRDLEWEHSLAERLGQKSERSPASISQNITLMDDMKYGPLAGKYAIRTMAKQDMSQISEIEYVSSDETTDSPIRLADSKTFLMKYRELMTIAYSNAELSYTSDGQEVWQLIDGKQNPVGRAKMSYDLKGNFVSVKFEKL